MFEATRRDCLKEVKPTATTNAGLWLDKFILNQGKDARCWDEGEDPKKRPPKRRLVEEIASLPVPAEYKLFFGGWEKRLDELGARCEEVKTAGRMIVGLGSEGVLEASVALHRTYGVPYIPGSALKGLAASFARHYCGEEWQKGSTFYRVVFGDTDDSGYVTFFDALYVPGSGRKNEKGDARALWPDVMTVHHQEYYQGKDGGRGDIKPPADWDDPNPVPFLSATGEYLIAVAAPAGCERWRNCAFDILCQALWHEGAGAKTSSGYGRLEMKEPPPDPDKSAADELIRRVRAIPANKLPSELGQQAGNLLGLAMAEAHKRRVAQAIIERTSEAGKKQERHFSEKAWYAALHKILKDG